jgi:predicted transposase YdaD
VVFKTKIMKKIIITIVLLLITITLFSQGTKNSKVYEVSSKLDGMFLQSYEDVTYSLNFRSILWF